ncbi:MAG: TolC family protein [Sulfurimonas sp.]|uniref:TolC family protein n=1 Tax=Sulfurimonas sp. TaxID=2022749 RepID=UPI0025EB6029|nr:TolC family protein [Sulfurimonas sp.]MCK9491045.1 TolC family protein [Sulfurimonas sp.]
MKTLKLLLLPLLCFGLEFDEIFDQTLNNSPQILAKYEKVLASRHAIDAEVVYKNPVINIGINNLPLNDNFLSRDIDSMQNQYIGISQEFETFGKLDLKEAMLRVDTLILEYELEDLKIDLYRKIALLVEEIQTKESILELVDQRKESLEVLLNYYERSVSLSDSLKSSVDLSRKIFELEDESFVIKDELASLKHEFKYLSSQEFRGVSRAKISDSFTDEGLKNSPAAKILELRTKRFDLQSKLEQREKYSNITLSMSYNNRQNFDDYLSFSTSFALPIYGSENAKVRVAKALSSEAFQKQSDFHKSRVSLFHKSQKRVEYLRKRLNSLEDLELRYSELEAYENSNIANSITLEKKVENQNLILELKVQKLRYKLDIKKAMFELYYITKESLS